MIRPWAVGIVVPARDEADGIEACVASVLAAELPTGAVRWVVVAADRCRDRTAERAARALGPAGEVIAVHAGNVGTARAAATDAVLARFRRVGASLDRTWLLTTDADSTVDPSWIGSHLEHADLGAAAVAGTVQVARFDEHPAGVPDAYRRQYTVHPDGTHPHVHGANLGVRADAYRSVGGWLPLVTAEDHDLWRRLGDAGYPTVSTVAAPVSTSGRRVGRAPDGFAALLASLADGATEAAR